MGFRYRKSLSFGPFRVNVGTRGVGVSVGGPGFRTGVGSNGRRYTTFGLPGTGMSYHKSHGKGCLPLLALPLLAAAAAAPSLIQRIFS
ncbi:MAG: hypothetical protein RL398_179 [Planctomycetota bacterium]